MLNDLNLLALLAEVGRPTLVGSAALGLMVWRDIDVMTRCSPPDSDRAFEALRPLASHPRITKLRYTNRLGRFSSPDELPEGLYWSPRYLSDAGNEWKLDLWFIAEDRDHPDLDQLETIPKQLTPETRLAILWIKDRWHRLPTYRNGVTSIDIYDAVLAHGMRTPSEFSAYLRTRGKPVE